MLQARAGLQRYCQLRCPQIPDPAYCRASRKEGKKKCIIGKAHDSEHCRGTRVSEQESGGGKREREEEERKAERKNIRAGGRD
jgi:hypothetical protein